MARRIIFLTLAATTAALLSSGAAASADEPAAPVACGRGQVCIYPQHSYQGFPLILNGSATNLGSYNDRTYSVINNSTKTARIWLNAGYDGKHTCVKPGTRIPNLDSYSVQHFGSSVSLNNDACG